MNASRLNIQLTMLTALALLLSVGLTGCGQKESDQTDTEVTPVVERPLKAELDSLREAFVAKAPAPMIEAFKAGIQEARESGVLASAIKVGDNAPDFTLTNASGNDVTLSEQLKSGPVVVMWYRGGWCPYCNIQLQSMQEHLPAMVELGATLIAISPEIPDSSLSTSERHSLGFEVLSDVGNTVARTYGIVYKQADGVNEIFKQMEVGLTEYNGDDSWELPLPATYVIDTDGVVRFAFADVDYRNRAEPADILTSLRSISHM